MAKFQKSKRESVKFLLIMACPTLIFAPQKYIITFKTTVRELGSVEITIMNINGAICRARNTLLEKVPNSAAQVIRVLLWPEIKDFKRARSRTSVSALLLKFFR